MKVVRVGRMERVDVVRRGLGLGLPGRGESVRTIDPRGGMGLPESNQPKFSKMSTIIELENEGITYPLEVVEQDRLVAMTNSAGKGFA